jgi:phosphoenolpyruvate carboxykinase (ATP)
MKLSFTRSIIDAIHSGALAGAPTTPDPVFGFDVVTACPNVPPEILIPKQTWPDPSAYDATARKLAGLFRENFKGYEAGASDELKAAGPR